MRATIILVNYVQCLAGDTVRMWFALNSSLSIFSSGPLIKIHCLGKHGNTLKLFRESCHEAFEVQPLWLHVASYCKMVGIVGDATQGDANAPNGTSRIVDLLMSASMPPALRCCHSNTARAYTHTHRGGKGRLAIGQVSLIRVVKRNSAIMKKYAVILISKNFIWFLQGKDLSGLADTVTCFALCCSLFYSRLTKMKKPQQILKAKECCPACCDWSIAYKTHHWMTKRTNSHWTECKITA